MNVTIQPVEDLIAYPIPLEAGWNLVSFPLHPVDTAPASLLADIAGSFNLVYAWDASGAHSGAGNWLSYDPSTPPFLNTLTAMDEKMGFWIYMSQADTLDITGTAPEMSTISLQTGAGGWNLVGYPSSSPGAMPGILGSADFSLMQAYHAADTSDVWKTFDPAILPGLNDLTELTAGWGYWIYIYEPYSWDVGY